MARFTLRVSAEARRGMHEWADPGWKILAWTEVYTPDHGWLVDIEDPDADDAPAVPSTSDDAGYEDFIVDEHFTEGPLYLRPGCIAAGCKGHATPDEPLPVPSTSDEDVYQRAARAYIDGNPAVSGSNPQAAAPDLAAHGPFRAAVDEARRDLLAVPPTSDTPEFRTVDESRQDLRQALWDIYGILGYDTDGMPTPDALVSPQLTQLVIDAARELRAENAQTGAELARFAEGGEWSVEYGRASLSECIGNPRRRLSDTHQRQVWRGPVQEVEETTE